MASKAERKLRLEWIDAATLRQNPKNWRRHPEGQRQALADAMKRVGWAGALLYNARTKRLIDGHLRQELFAEKHGMVPVLIGSWTPKQEALILATLDPIGSLAEADPEALEGLLDDVGETTPDLDALLGDLALDAGIDLDESPAVDDPGPQVHRADQLQRKWRVKAGQLYVIPSKSAGRQHRLMCGDSTSAEDVGRLMAGKTAALMSTDPPYMVDYKGTNRPKRAGRGTASGGCDWSRLYREVAIKDKESFPRRVFSTWLGHLEPNAAWFVWHADATRYLFEDALREMGVHLHQIIVWVKPAVVPSFAKYRYRHEPCMFGWRKGHVPLFARNWFKQDHTTVWEADWDGKARPTEHWHPTEKPTAVFALPIKNHTSPGAVCAEPFAGSGSQYVAAEGLGRLVYGMEIVPEFVAAILERLSITGLQPRLATR